ncbi:PP2C family serine/threonine-protein phosphatase [uncultured Bifidobacterium sp.]|uniref:PP2C family protein-serine/threonine phosphatase n=1 Tax=uncultured Bifidobacterium sp. TaxID=165187 RepID=UPI0028DD1795|nr:PP2C family serine/threonine-protein phosphatase [uncultured Bifidobacterium sp.]
MPNSAASQQLFLYSTTVSDVGTVRSNNQDSSFAGEHLIAICDGMGGHAGGDTASTIAIRSLAHIEHDDLGGDVATVSSMMETSVMAAHDAIVGRAKRDRSLAGMGTTVTAVVLVAGFWIITHIGDSRAYLLRDGRLSRMTTDHSYVQHLIDTGRITPSEARNHPQRNVVMRVIGDFDIDPHPDVSIRRARPADRWLLCSDGLCGVLEDSTIEEILASTSDLEQCAQTLVSLALKAGSTDNVTAVVGDATLALDASSFVAPHQTPLIGGAASVSLEPIADIVNQPVATAPALNVGRGSPAQKAAALAQTTADGISHPHLAQPSTVREQTGEKADLDTSEIPVVQKRDGQLTADPNDPEVVRVMRDNEARKSQEQRSRRRRRRATLVAVIVVVLAGLTVAFAGIWHWSQSSYYLGESDGVVTIYQGVPTNLFGVSMSHAIEHTTIRISSLPRSWRDQLSQGITMDTLSDARQHVQLIRQEATTLSSESSSHKSGAATGSASPSSSATSSSSSATAKGGA